MAALEAIVQQHALQPLSPFPSSNRVPPLKSPTRSGYHPFHQAESDEVRPLRRGSDVRVKDDGNNTHTSSVRRRISRACDQCNQLRTKCDGKGPCAHCVEFGLLCEYIRKRKKRGKASRKDITWQASGLAGSLLPESPPEPSSDETSPTQPLNGLGFQTGTSQPSSTEHGSVSKKTRIVETPAQKSGGLAPLADGYQADGKNGPDQIQRENPPDQLFQHQARAQDNILPEPHSRLPANSGSGISPTAVSLNGFSLNQDYNRPGVSGANLHGSSVGHSGNGVGHPPLQLPSHQSFMSLGDNIYPAGSPQNMTSTPSLRFGPTGESPLNGFFGNSPLVGSPGWLNLPSPVNYQQHPRYVASTNTLRFPVLRPVLPFIESTIPISLACDLLELYFTSSSTTHVHPISPYILGYVFRKKSFLDPNKPRTCSPALLSSMLWLAAQTSDSPFLTSPPSARGRVCQKLLEITIGLLKPLVHSPPVGGVSTASGADSIINGVALGGLGVAMTGGDPLTVDGGVRGPLDNVATYIHLAVIVSASEYKAASMRWWNTAWTLARELRLGRELPLNPIDSESVRNDILMEDVAPNSILEQTTGKVRSNGNLPANVPRNVSEEEQEERRRVWWLLYSVDRHLALCYNRPLFLLDVECESLQQPMDDDDWQAGNFYGGHPGYNSKGPYLLCTGHSFFGFFTPLMVILGYIVDLNQARNHPRFSRLSRSIAECEDHAVEITSHLEAYGQSLKKFESYHMTKSNQRNDLNHSSSDENGPSGVSGVPQLTDSMIQTKIVVAYGTHIMHVLHILVAGKWDPITLLDDNDLWISTTSFQNAMSHAVAAANAIGDILEYDPDLSFMPFLFGISLLQGGFLFLLTADKLAGEANPNVVRACENIIKAHEACIVTLNTEYQRHMRKVMRSALAQVKGRTPDDFGEQRLRRREVLSLYRWTGDGTGLAL